MNTTTDILKKLLLEGRHITKFDFLTYANSTCLQQRVHELARQGWNIKSKAVVGKGTLKEYWLENGEIERIKTQKEEIEQSLEQTEKVAEKPLNKPKLQSSLTEKGVKIEQMGLGLPWQ